MFDELGRLQKARKTVAVMLDALDKVGVGTEETRLLDIGCSTGILTRHYAEFFGEVVGVDIDDGAVEWARQNRAVDNLSYQVGDSMNLPFLTNDFDIVTCTHIYEHVPDATRMLDEINRVLRPGGRLLVLEFSQVWKPLKPLYDAYSFKVLPLLGKLVANDADSYRYLAESIRVHPSQSELAEMLRNAGFDGVDYFNLSAGVVALQQLFQPPRRIDSVAGSPVRRLRFRFRLQFRCITARFRGCVLVSDHVLIGP